MIALLAAVSLFEPLDHVKVEPPKQIEICLEGGSEEITLRQRRIVTQKNNPVRVEHRCTHTLRSLDFKKKDKKQNTQVEKHIQKIREEFNKAPFSNLQTRIEYRPCHDDHVVHTSFDYTVTADLKPNEIKRIRHCNGHMRKHWLTEKEKNEGKMETRWKKEEAQLKSQFLTSIIQIHPLGGKYRITWTYFHKDNCPECKRHHEEPQDDQKKTSFQEVVLQAPPPVWIDRWQADDPDLFKILEDKHRCRLLAVHPVGGSQMHTIEGESVYRDYWAKDLLFRCPTESSCQQIRAKGGKLIEKKCLNEKLDLWEKTYDLSEEGSYAKPIYSSDVQIHGFQGENDKHWKRKKSKDFEEIAALLSLSKEAAQDNPVSEEGDLTLLPGTMRSCRRDVTSSDPIDECGELALSNRCRFIGTKQTDEGTELVYCCYASALARMAHEQLRSDWGTAECPNCRALTQQEFDFTSLQLQEAADDFSVNEQDSEQLMKELESSMIQTVLELKP